VVWTVDLVSDAHGPAANVRNYHERKTIRVILEDISRRHKIIRACEVGSGYGRVVMVLKEFAESVKGFEREPHLVEAARPLLPDIQFDLVESLTDIVAEEPCDLVMTFTVLQHMTDSDVIKVCEVMKKLAPKGYVLCIEMTDPIDLVDITKDVRDCDICFTKARPVSRYKELMYPYKLVSVRERVIEPTCFYSSHAGTCMLFASPAVQNEWT